MNVISCAREARRHQRHFRYWEDEIHEGFFGKVVRKNWTPDNKLIVGLRSFGEEIDLEAEDNVARILEAALLIGKEYNFSGLQLCEEFDYPYLRAGVGSEISRRPRAFDDRPLPFFEFVASVDFLHELVVKRNVVTEDQREDLEEERFYVTAVISDVTKTEKDTFYKGCILDKPECYSKKVEPRECKDGKIRYYCPRCGHFDEKFIWRVMPKITLVDPEDEESGTTITVAIFKESAEKLFGRTEQEMVQMMEEECYEELEAILEAVIGHKLLLRLRACQYQHGMSLSVDKLF